MNNKSFLPEFGAAHCVGGFHGLFRLFEDDKWRKVMDGKKPSVMPSYAEAVEASKAEVRRRINPPITSQQTAARAVFGAAAQWLANKHDKRAMEQIARRRGTSEVILVEVKGGKRIANRT